MEKRMELMNYLVGTSRGEYPVERREAFLVQMQRLINALKRENKWDEDDWLGQEYENETFLYYPFMVDYDECDCGYLEQERAWCNVHDHSPECYQNRYLKVERQLSPRSLTRWAKRNGCKSAPRGMAVYCDCGYETAWRKFVSGHQHKRTCIVRKPNFHHKRSGLRISWYKYPFRDSYSSHLFTVSQFANVIDDCLRSIGINVKKRPVYKLHTEHRRGKDGLRLEFAQAKRDRHYDPTLLAYTADPDCLCEMKCKLTEHAAQFFETEDEMRDAIVWAIAELFDVHMIAG